MNLIRRPRIRPTKRPKRFPDWAHGAGQAGFGRTRPDGTMQIRWAGSLTFRGSSHKHVHCESGRDRNRDDALHKTEHLKVPQKLPAKTSWLQSYHPEPSKHRQFTRRVAQVMSLLAPLAGALRVRYAPWQ